MFARQFATISDLLVAAQLRSIGSQQLRSTKGIKFTVKEVPKPKNSILKIPLKHDPLQRQYIISSTPDFVCPTILNSYPFAGQTMFLSTIQRDHRLLKDGEKDYHTIQKFVDDYIIIIESPRNNHSIESSPLNIFNDRVSCCKLPKINDSILHSPVNIVNDRVSDSDSDSEDDCIELAEAIMGDDGYNSDGSKDSGYSSGSDTDSGRTD